MAFVDDIAEIAGLFVDPWSDSRFDQLINDARTLAEEDKKEGNRLFQRGEYEKCYGTYLRGLELFEDVPPVCLKGDARRLNIILCCNAAQALLKLDAEGTVNEVLRMTNRALLLEPENVKALFRRGCASAHGGLWDVARLDFLRVLQLDPVSEFAERELRKCEDALALEYPLPNGLAVDCQEPEIRGCVKEVKQGAGSQEVSVVRASGPEEAVTMAEAEAERLQADILGRAEAKNCSFQWRVKLEKIRQVTSSWIRHQLNDPECVDDLNLLHGELFTRMTSQQREQFLLAYDWVREVRSQHGEELEVL